MKIYKDKNNNLIKDEDYIYVDKKVCQALRCDNGTLLYEELLLKSSKIELTDNPIYPDAYEPYEVEIISHDRVIGLLKENIGND